VTLSTATESLPKAEAIPAQPRVDQWPRIALVTPVLNSSKYIEATIRSVLAQGYPNLEYFVVDGGSTDGTIDIIRKYENQISGWVSGPDKGMYDAINKGFARTSGEIMGWISATDMLHLGGLFVAGSVFRDLPEVEWIMGLPSGFTDEGMANVIYGPRRFSRYRFLAGANRYIMQEATFWRRSLWDKAGGYVDASRRYVSDFELWVRFFRHARLYPVHALIGGYRKHPDALGISELAECHRIHNEVINSELRKIPHGKAVKLFRGLGDRMKKIPGLRFAWWRFVECPLNTWRGPDFAPIIYHDVDKGGWVFAEKSPSRL
jgi:glycosyltransferase involved in cell wall biosynthesis